VFLIVGLGLIFLGLVGWIRPLVGDRWFRAIEVRAVGIARRERTVLVGIGLATVLARLAVLPWLPVPQPIIHDEFSNLLAADTFVHGRLSNPAHPMSAYFDTFHVLQHPTYASKYPPATGLVLALGELAGNPWFGTLLSMALMCAAITWMLQGWFPPEWALLGGTLALFRLCLFNYWFDSYLGAAIATLGAALVLGAFPRITRSWRTLDAIWLALGMVILVLSRPFEGFLFCLPAAVMLPLVAMRQIHQPGKPRPRFFKTIVVPVTAVLGLGLIWLGYYNWRVTGNAFVFPYSLYHKQYFGYPIFVWQSVPPPRHYANPQFEVFFNEWHRSTYQLTFKHWARRLENNWLLWWLIYLGPALTIPFLAFGRVVRARKARLPLMQVGVTVVGLASIVWFQPHYAAPIFAAVITLMVAAFRHLRRFCCSGRPVGIYLSRLAVVLALDWVLILGVHTARNPERPWSTDRLRIAQQLASVPGQHLVLVDYSPDHDVHEEWVSNAADIDKAKIVWARDIPGLDLQPLLRYFDSRKVWVVRPDEEPPVLEVYQGTNSYRAP
jgi:hypothetical protein